MVLEGTLADDTLSFRWSDGSIWKNKSSAPTTTLQNTMHKRKTWTNSTWRCEEKEKEKMARSQAGFHGINFNLKSGNLKL